MDCGQSAQNWPEAYLAIASPEDQKHQHGVELHRRDNGSNRKGGERQPPLAKERAEIATVIVLWNRTAP